MKFLSRYIVRMLIYMVGGFLLLYFVVPVIEGDRLSVLEAALITLITGTLIALFIYIYEIKSQKHSPIIKATKNVDEEHNQLTLSDGEFEILCKHRKLRWTDEEDFKPGYTINKPIQAYCEGAVKKVIDEDSIKYSPIKPNYVVIGKLENKKKSILVCGKFQFCIDLLIPETINNGDTVRIEVAEFR
jgi:hypothetical protein